MKIAVTSTLAIDEQELAFDFIRAAGPGGQNVNKVATAVQLRFNLRGTHALTEDAKTRLSHLAGRRMTGEGILIIEARRFRTQEQNREAAIQRFRELVRKALEVPKPRRKTRPTTGSKEERLQSKKRRGKIKQTRQKYTVE